MGDAAPMTPQGRLLLRSLTQRERRVVSMVCSGLPNRKIAERLDTTEQVVKNYLRSVYAKSGARHRCELVVFCFRSGLVECTCKHRSQTSAEMSSLIYYTDETQALVATDTLATTCDGHPGYFATKAFPLPHLQMVLAGTGLASFADQWLMRINNAPVRGIEDLDSHAPQALAVLWEQFRQAYPGISGQSTTTVYHFGFSETTQLMRAFAYRSDNGFKSEPVEGRVGVKPGITLAEGWTFPDDIPAIMEKQRSFQAKRPRSDRIHIGGEIHVIRLEAKGFTIHRLAKFADFDKHASAIFKKAIR
jgi:DNA-binding CsgD family transcriptional regulator